MTANQEFVNKYLPLDTEQKIIGMLDAMVKERCPFDKAEKRLLVANVDRNLKPFFYNKFSSYKKEHGNCVIKGSSGIVLSKQSIISNADMEQYEENFRKEKIKKGCQYIDRIFAHINNGIDVGRFFVNCPVVWTTELYDYLQKAVEKSQLSSVTKGNFYKELGEYRNPRQIEEHKEKVENQHNDWVRILYTPMK